MLTRNFLNKSIRFALIGSAASVALSAPMAIAADESEEKVERISVTGSRIMREGVESPSPVTVISGADLANSGALNIGEVLNELPALANTYSLANSGRFIGTAGLNILDLRNMGTDRTLVLVNGKRHVSSAAGSASVDTNTIPSIWIDRVEIITGGASAVYGADAVTGVVNFILKDNIEGLDVSFTRGFADDNPYNNGKYTFSYGQNFDEDKGNIAFAVEYSEQDRLRAFDRKSTSTSLRSLNNPNQIENNDSIDNPDKILYENAGLWSINNAGVYTDLFSGGNNHYTFNPDGSFRPLYLGENIDGLSCVDCEFFNLRQFTDLQPKFDRINANLKGHYEFDEDHQAYFSAKFVQVNAEDHGQAAFYHFDGRNTIKRDNPFIHESLAAFMDENEMDSIRINRMMTDLGQRIEEDERETKRFVIGAKGLLGDDWDYDISAIYGVTDHTRVNLNNLVHANYANALDAIDDGNGNIVCRDADARAAGCAPLNIFGFGAPSQEAIDYINVTSVGSSKIQQTVFSGSLTNSNLFDLPAGEVGLATGVEYRKEESETFEPENAAGTFFNALGEDKGSFTVKEVFAELSVPLLADLPLVENLNFDTAVRFADYSSIGNATSWKVGLDWSVGFGLKFRSTYSEALRAPNIGELFGAESETFYRITDVCKEKELANLSDASNRRANCAAVGVPAGFDEDYDASTRRGLSSGNLNLTEEKGESLTIGAVYQPEFLDGASITVDYWQIQLTDAISSVGAQDIVDRCVDSKTGIDNIYCNRITRDESGRITLIRNSVLNLAGQDASGVDFEFGYNTELFSGDLKATLLGTYLIERKDYAFQEDPTDFTENAGTTGEAEWQANLSLAYTQDNWAGTWKTRYLENVSLYTEQEFELNPNPNNVLSYPSYVITDVTLGYNFDNGVSLKVGVDNLFDKDIPFGTTAVGSGSASYDNIGRFFYTTLSYSM